ncbi:MAG: QueT transporter family protein [Eubacteriales bacterium]
MRREGTAVWITQAGIIAAMYAVLTIVLAPISYGPVQFRIAEALTILPFFTTAAIPGLFIGCLIANLFGGNGLPDIVFGSLATLAAAFISSKIKTKWLVPLPSVVINAFVVGFVLNITLGVPYWATVGWVGFGQAVTCYGLGMIFLYVLEKYKYRVFMQPYRNGKN